MSGGCLAAALTGKWLFAEAPQSATSSAPTLDELLLFRPTRFPEGEWELQDLDSTDVWFTAADGIKLHGWYCPHEKPVATVLYVHGTGGNLSDRRFLLKLLQTELRLSVFIFDYRGYGRSEGVPSVKGALLDSSAAREELVRLAGVGTGDIVLMGRSLGGAIAIQLAADEAPRGLIVESSFSSLKDMAALHYPNLAWLVPADKL
ncbi:MAG: alpha/beta hydrolase, partial [Planctomycetaceae bacterium]